MTPDPDPDADTASDGTCPLCLDETRLQFHHWDYEDGIGVCLCAECHRFIHSANPYRASFDTNGPASVTQQKEWLTQIDTPTHDLPLDCWQDLAYINLAIHLIDGLDFPDYQQLTPSEHERDGMAFAKLIEYYNIPSRHIGKFLACFNFAKTFLREYSLDEGAESTLFETLLRAEEAYIEADQDAVTDSVRESLQRHVFQQRSINAFNPVQNPFKPLENPFESIDPSLSERSGGDSS